MAKYYEYLKAIMDEYYRVEKNKHHIESKTAIVMVNTKYVENLRHSYSHLMAGLKLELDSGSEEKIIEQYRHSCKHLSDLDVNGYEYLSGVLLRRLKQRIEKAGFFINIGNSENCLEEALDHFGRGRSLRTENKQIAMESFEKAIDLCTDGLRQIVSVTKVNKNMAKISIGAFIISSIAVLFAILAYYK